MQKASKSGFCLKCLQQQKSGKSKKKSKASTDEKKVKTKKEKRSLTHDKQQQQQQLQCDDHVETEGLTTQELTPPPVGSRGRGSSSKGKR